MAQQSLVSLRSIVERFDMFLWNHQQVSRRLGVDVANNYRPIVAVDEVSGNLPGDYPAKKATWF